MSDIRKIYMPKWMTWFGLAMVAPIWGLVTYRVFFIPGDSDFGVTGWVVTTLVLAGFAAILILMGRRKLPVYLMEVEGDRE